MYTGFEEQRPVTKKFELIEALFMIYSMMGR